MKPFMIRVFADELGNNADWKQRAISVSSHNGDAIHVATAQSLLPESQWGFMQTPLDVPLIQFGRQVRRPRRWFHTCSGEHAGILRGCSEKGWPMAGYMLPHHPFFAAYLEQVRRFLGPDWTPKRLGRDGCGLPTMANTVAELSQLFSGLAATREEDWIWEAMQRHPDLVGGFNRLDSTIIKCVRAQSWRKGGGLLGMALCIQIIPKNSVSLWKLPWLEFTSNVVYRAFYSWDLSFELVIPTLYTAKSLHRRARRPPALREHLNAFQYGTVGPDRDRFHYDWQEYMDASQGENQ